MAKRTSQPLSYAGFVSKDPDNSTQVERARELLLRTICKLCPEFSGKLLSDVFPIYQRQAEQGETLDDILWHTAPYRLLKKGELKRALSRWAKQFNASDAEWLLDVALRTLFRWNGVREFKEERSWAHPGKVLSFTTASIGQHFKFDFMGWETQLYSWGYYCNLAREHFEKRLVQYRKETVKVAKAAGLVPAQSKYAECNFEWFALHQFMGLSQSQIVSRIATSDMDATADESTVRKGIQAVVKLTGWKTIRSSRKVRNRKIQ